VLGVSEVKVSSEYNHRGDAECAEITQRRSAIRRFLTPCHCIYAVIYASISFLGEAVSMARTTILLDHDLLLEVKQLARTNGTTATNVIREALKSYLERNRPRRKLSFTAAGKSGRRSIAKDAEKILRRKASRKEGW
jgi:predicted transcriptional regulator